ncbi:unnamed protein product [Darwinula stevensoni]|uniref:Uncharacterized protein n=1 Tax=Darwinula stevensoni TaxID=69355 RepID=A0A7R9A8E3_9CRUS|nr:unnamed protein product [Darwinula stevensoni]CAG0896284.1 unnamed protein product [Darwinula stevensoni]
MGWHVAKGDEMADVLEGDVAVLECRFEASLIRGSPTTLYWIRTNNAGTDNVAIGDILLQEHYRVSFHPEEGRYDLYIEGATYTRDNGRFECKVKERGTGKDLYAKDFHLTVLIPPGPPEFSPRTPLVVEGNSVELICSSIGGSPDPQIKWYREGDDHPLESVTLQPGRGKDSQTKAILTFTAKKDDDGAVFRCVIWNRALEQGKVLEARIQLGVQYFPRVTVGPVNPVKVLEGSSVALECKVDAKPPAVGVRWMRNGRVLSRGYRHSLDRLEVANAGEYVCQADNGLGQMGQGSLEVEVLHGPRVSVQERLEVREGETARLECSVASNPRPIRVEWRKKSQGDGKEEEGSSSSSNFHVQGETLLLRHVEPRDAGFYVCTATVIMDPEPKTGTGMRMERQENATSQLVVRHGPGEAEIRTSPGMGIAGQPLTLLCSASPRGYPPPVFTWWKQDSPGTPLAMGPNLTLPILSLASEGVYQCSARNQMGQGSPGSYNLEVAQPPNLLNVLEPNAIREAGDPAFFVNCSATGKPRPEVRWMRNEDEIQPENPLYEIQTETSVGRQGVFTVTSRLFFRGPGRNPRTPDTDSSGAGHLGLSPLDAARYTCRFHNHAGDAQNHQVLRIQHSPIWEAGPEEAPPPSEDSFLDVHEVTSESWESVWKAFNGPLRTQASLEAMRDFLLKIGKGGSYGHVKMAGSLKEAAHLECRVRAFPRPRFQWFRVRDRIKEGSREIEEEDEVKGSAGGKYESNSTSTGRDVHVGVLRIRDLVEEDFGSYICRTSNALGRSDTRIVVGPRGPPDPPLPPRALASGSSWILISWLPGFHGGLPDSIKFIVSATSSINPSQETLFDCQDSNPCNITGLDPHTSYAFKVRAFNVMGKSDYSQGSRLSTSDSQLANAESFIYGRDKHTFSLSTPPRTLLPLMAVLEVKIEGSEWRHLYNAILDHSSMEFSLEDLDSGLRDKPIQGLRVRLCKLDDTSVCGDSAEALIRTHHIESLIPSFLLDFAPGEDKKGGMGGGGKRYRLHGYQCQEELNERTGMGSWSLSLDHHVCFSTSAVDRLPDAVLEAEGFPVQLLAVIVVSCFAFLALLLAISYCCCCRRKDPKAKAKAKDSPHHPPSGLPVPPSGPPPPYYSATDKGLYEASSPSAGAQIQGSHHHQQNHSHNIYGSYPNGGSYAMDQSYSASASHNGGSVNSQDSLWKPPADDGSYRNLDPVQAHHGHGLGLGDYAHYPMSHGERGELLVGEDGAYLRRATDSFGLDGVHHTHSGGVSGLPDPYGGGTQARSFEESLESGYSTPNSRNRRVIREIIV